MEDSLINGKGNLNRKFMQYLFYGFFAFFIEWIFLLFFSIHNPIFVLGCIFFLLQFYQLLMHIIFFKNIRFCFKQVIYYLFLWIISFFILWYYPQWFSSLFILKMLGISFIRFLLVFFFSCLFKIVDAE